MNCFFCKGDITNSTTNHVVNFDNCIIIIKNVPCEKCVQCGESYFSDEVTQKLEEIVSKAKEIVSDVGIFEYYKMAS